MRFASFQFRSQDLVGIVDGDEIAIVPGEFGDLVAVIEGGTASATPDLRSSRGRKA